MDSRCRKFGNLWQPVGTGQQNTPTVSGNKLPTLSGDFRFLKQYVSFLHDYFDFRHRPFLVPVCLGQSNGTKLYGPWEDIGFVGKQMIVLAKRYPKNPQGGFPTFQVTV